MAMTYALISPIEDVIRQGSRVGARVAQVEAEPFPIAEPFFWVEVPDGTVADDVMWNGAAVVPAPPHPPAPAQVLPPISAMQLSGALLLAGKITAAEARAFGRAGVIPAAIEAAVIAALGSVGQTADEIQIALLKLESATEYHRDHPLTPIIGLALGMDATALDALWLAALEIV